MIEEVSCKWPQLLISQQIYAENLQLRVDRLEEYEDKIIQRRRVVGDKEGLYQMMTNKKKSIIVKS